MNQELYDQFLVIVPEKTAYYQGLSGNYPVHPQIYSIQTLRDPRRRN